MNKITIMEDWIKSLENDPIIGGTINETAVSMILYGLYQYGVTGEKVDLGKVFGKQFAVYNYALLGLYPQVDKMQKYSKGVNKGGKYDNDAIRELASQGMGPKAICEKLGYDSASAKSISSNKGYKDGREEYKNREKGVETFGF